MNARLYLADARSMQELENESVQLIITSPPYWHIKDYGVKTSGEKLFKQPRLPEKTIPNSITLKVSK